jgi:hypothetical protein
VLQTSYKVRDLGHSSRRLALAGEPIGVLFQRGMEDGREYDAHHGSSLRFHPVEAASRPSTEFLMWHNETKLQT